MECFKVVWDLPKNFVGPPAGLRRLTGVQKMLHCPKMSKNRDFWLKFGRESGRLILTCSFSFQILNYNVLWPQKILYDVPAPSGYIRAAQKRTILLKIAKITKKYWIFISKNGFFKCAQTIEFLLFLILKQVKYKINYW